MAEIPIQRKPRRRLWPLLLLLLLVAALAWFFWPRSATTDTAPAGTTTDTAPPRRTSMVPPHGDVVRVNRGALVLAA